MQSLISSFKYICLKLRISVISDKVSSRFGRMIELNSKNIELEGILMNITLIKCFLDYVVHINTVRWAIISAGRKGFSDKSCDKSASGTRECRIVGHIVTAIGRMACTQPCLLSVHLTEVQGRCCAGNCRKTRTTIKCGRYEKSREPTLNMPRNYARFILMELLRKHCV